ncbi:MAG: hypothetical protein MPK62_02040 [Alphaproteobacteria bacterium]|nr:hypothetical protein [Alphaproteobacteria bacterium]MDA8029914.1 hypothetical protein [Alphaproteobacteria bacterium]
MSSVGMYHSKFGNYLVEMAWHKNIAYEGTVGYDAPLPIIDQPLGRHDGYTVSAYRGNHEIRKKIFASETPESHMLKYMKGLVSRLRREAGLKGAGRIERSHYD